MTEPPGSRMPAPLAPADRPAALLTLLETRFGAGRAVVTDDSHHHAGHAGAGGAGHFRVEVLSEEFAGLGMLARHRLVYAAAAPLMPQDIHALSISALTPAEAGTR